MKKLIALGVLASLMITSCAETYRPSQSAYESGLIGAATGAAAGSILTNNNKWKGGVIGGTIGAIAGAAISEVAKRGAIEASQNSQPVRYQSNPVQYQSNDGMVAYQSQPDSYNAQTKCHKVHEKIYKNGKLVKNQVREVCNSDKTEEDY